MITLVDEFIAKNKDSILIKKTHFDLNGDFASFKNNGKSYCTKEWIFQIDADETLSETFGTVITPSIRIKRRNRFNVCTSC